MQTIYKYSLKVADEQVIPLPTGAQILTVQLLGSTPCIWALVDSKAPLQDRVFIIYGTGNPIGTIPTKYIGTFQQGLFVWHVFEKTKRI